MQPKSNKRALEKFNADLATFYAQHRREFDWRTTTDPYKITVSEFMLQQTQTERVVDKYAHFINLFPTITTLAQAPTAAVLTAWQGLGYNRRALYLHQFAQAVLEKHAGTLPLVIEQLNAFKGIGSYTAAAIYTFATNRPTVFIETNIRAVFLHHFFKDKTAVPDSEILPVIEKALDIDDPRNWYYAVMDYGVLLKKQHKNPSRKSAHHTVQSKFEGSDRQVRGLILKKLIELPLLSVEEFYASINRTPVLISKIIADLENEGFIKQVNGLYTLA